MVSWPFPPQITLSHGLYSQLLQVAVGNVVAAPVRHRIELDTMRELHFVLLVKASQFLCPLGVTLRKLLFSVLDTRVVDELEFLEVYEPVGARRGRWPSSTGQPRQVGGTSAEGGGFCASGGFRADGGLGRSYGG